MSTASDLPPNLPHAPAGDNEEVYYEGSPLLRAEGMKLAGFWLVGLIFLAAPIVIAVMARDATHRPGLIAWAICLLVAAGCFFYPSLRLRTVRYRITNYRIDYERGVFSKNIDTIELWHVEDIRFHQSLLDRIMSVGTITIISHDDTTPLLVLSGLPNPRPLFETLKQRVIAVKRQSGVLKVDPG